MRILFLASGVFAQPSLRWLASSGHDVPLLITQPAKASGRGRHVTRTPAHALADELGIPVLATEDVNSSETIARIRALNIHLGLVIAFGQKLGRELLSAAPGGFINLHASLLPKYRGAAPINWAIVAGEKRTGCTVFRIAERMDAGPVLTQDAMDILPLETAGELHDRLAELGVQTVRAALAQFQDGQVPAGNPQDESQKTTAPKLKKTDGHVRFDRPAASLVAHIHGMTPWPGAAARFEAEDGRWEDVMLIRARSVPSGGGNGRSTSAQPMAQAHRPPGELDASLRVSTLEGSIEILEIKPFSGRLMTWSDYVNGRRVSPGDRFVSVASPEP